MVAGNYTTLSSLKTCWNQLKEWKEKKQASLVNGQKTATKPMKCGREGECQKPPNFLRRQVCRCFDSHKLSRLQRSTVILWRVHWEQGCDGPRRRTVTPTGQKGGRAKLKGDTWESPHLPSRIQLYTLKEVKDSTVWHEEPKEEIQEIR